MPPWLRQLSPKAILAGGVADIVATNVVLTPVAVMVFAKDPASLAPGFSGTKAFAAALDASASLSLVVLLLGSLCSVLGGWLAARIAGRAELLHGAFSAFACVLLSIYGVAVAPGVLPAWQHAALVVLAAALGALGGMLHQRRLFSRAPAIPHTGSEEPAGGRPGHRVLLIANRGLLALVVAAAAFFLLGFLLIPEDDTGTRSVSGVLVVVLLGAALCYLIAGRALKGGHVVHWAWHAAAATLTAAPLGLLALGFWIAGRTE